MSKNSFLSQMANSKHSKKHFNPNFPIANENKQPKETHISIYEYDEKRVTNEQVTTTIPIDIPHPKYSNQWINIEGLSTQIIQDIARQFNIHPLIAEDILSVGQRAKTDEINKQLFCLLPMLRYNEDTLSVEQEQLGIILSNHTLLTFQQEPYHDPFKVIREKLKLESFSCRKRSIDYLFYNLIDAVIDDYFNILDKLSDRIEVLEDIIMDTPKPSILFALNKCRREIMVAKRAIMPVRDVVGMLWRGEHSLIKEENKKYFKDIFDHISLATEYVDNYREMGVNLQELYMNKVNTRMNEVMKFLTLVTTILAPATVIGSIYGMNFEHIPFSGEPYGFYICVGIMVIISILMVYIFKKKRWI